MYAVVYQVDMNENWEGDPVEAMDQLAAFAKAMPGFIRGTWTFPDAGLRGLIFTLWASEGEARTVADIPHPPDGPVKIRSVDVYEMALDA